MSFSFRPLLFAACMALALPAQARDFRAAETQVTDYPTVEGVRYMGKLLNERSSGRLNIKVFANGTLGNERDTIEQLKIGGVDMIRLSVAPLNNIVPETIVLSLPFIFRSEDHMHTVLDGPIGDEILAAMEKQGIIGLAWYDDGARSVYTKGRPVRTLADLQGHEDPRAAIGRVRLDGRSLGASPTPLPYGEVYTALTTGIIDAAENSILSYETSRHFESALLQSDRAFAPAEPGRVLQGDLGSAAREGPRADPPGGQGLRPARARARSRSGRPRPGKSSRPGRADRPGREQRCVRRRRAPMYAKFATTPEFKSLVERIQATK